MNYFEAFKARSAGTLSISPRKDVNDKLLASDEMLTFVNNEFCPSPPTAPASPSTGGFREAAAGDAGRRVRHLEQRTPPRRSPTPSVHRGRRRRTSLRADLS